MVAPFSRLVGSPTGLLGFLASVCTVEQAASHPRAFGGFHGTDHAGGMLPNGCHIWWNLGRFSPEKERSSDRSSKGVPAVRLSERTGLGLRRTVHWRLNCEAYSVTGLTKRILEVHDCKVHTLPGRVALCTDIEPCALLGAWMLLEKAHAEDKVPVKCAIPKSNPTGSTSLQPAIGIGRCQKTKLCRSLQVPSMKTSRKENNQTTKLALFAFRRNLFPSRVGKEPGYGQAS
jgi:hypothetical protein